MALEVRREVDIDRSPVDVFAFLADTASFALVDRALVAWTPDGPLTSGMTGTFEHRRGWTTARTTWRVEELEPTTHLRVSIVGSGYAMDETADLIAAGEGTHVVFVDRVWPTSLAGRVLVALSGGVMRRDLAQRSALLKAAIETR